MTGHEAAAERPAHPAPAGSRPGPLPATVGLLALVLALHWGAVLGRGVFFQRDIAAYWLPEMESFVRIVASGSWPLWNPYVSFGTPLLADPNLAFLYPLTWLNLVLDPGTYYTVFVVVHALWGAVGVNLLARKWGLSGVPAFAAGAAWCLSGPVVSAANLFHHYAGASWMAWVLLGFEGALEGPAGALGLAVASAGQVLAGSGDMCLATGALALARALVGPGAREHWNLRAAATALAGLAWGASLSAAQWMGTLGILGDGSRLGLQAATTGYWSLHPASLVELLVPRLLTDLPLGDAARAALFESREPLLSCLYSGVAAAGLVVLGVSAGRFPFRGLCAALFLACLLFALGRHTPLLGLVSRLPPVRLFRFPAKALLPGSLLWAMLVGSGVSVLLGAWPGGREARREARWAVMALLLFALAAAALAAFVHRSPEELGDLLAVRGAGGAAAVAALTSKLTVASAVAVATAALLLLRTVRATAFRPLGLGVLALSLADLFLVARGVNPLAPRDLFRHRPPLLESMRPHLGDRRVFSRGYSLAHLNSSLARRPEGWEAEWAFALGGIDRFQAPGGARWGAYGSFDGDFTGLAAPEQSALTGLAQETVGTPAGTRLLQLANVGYVVSLGGAGSPGLRPVGEEASVFRDPVRLYEVDDPLPWAYAVEGVRVVPRGGAALALLAPGFEPRREVVLSEGAAVEASPGFGATLRPLWRRADNIGLEVEASAPCVAVVVDAYGSGWRASVDGRRAPILRANDLFRAVRLPAGSHRVEMSYRPVSVEAGLGASALGGAVLAVALVRRAQRAGWIDRGWGRR